MLFVFLETSLLQWCLPSAGFSELPALKHTLGEVWVVNASAFLLIILASSIQPRACRTVHISKYQRLWHWMLLLPYVALIMFDQCACAVLVASWISCRFLTACLFYHRSDRWCRAVEKEKQTNKASPTFLMCACVYGLVDTFCVSPFSLGVYGNSCFFFSHCPLSLTKCLRNVCFKREFVLWASVIKTHYV